MKSLCLIALLLIASASALHATKHEKKTGSIFQEKYGHPGSANCTTNWFDQWTDHYSFGQPSGQASTMQWQQRYLTYDNYYKPGGPIFFYCGNEAPITAFVDIAGLMWQTAERFNAALVFAEHRFYGESQPCPPNAGGNPGNCSGQLNSMQAIADYATLLTNLTAPGNRYADSEGIITFGGSYGGMLSAWFRMKYPNLITGSIASSAPIRMVSEDYDVSSYWRVITRDATAAAGAAPACAANVNAAITEAFKLLETAAGAQVVSELFSTCETLPTGADGQTKFGYFIQSAFDILGMGNYPMPLDFMFGTPTHPAPAYPMRVACEQIAGNYSTNIDLIAAMRRAIDVFYNVTENVKCYDTNQNPTSNGPWDYMVCSERMINELPYFAAKGWPNDMFWKQKVWTHDMYNEHCKDAWNVLPRYGWLNTTYGAGNLEGASKIVFANGLFDPWHSGGILWNVSETIKSYIIPEGAHHLDLLFETSADPPGVKWVRERQVSHIRDWLRELKESKKDNKKRQ